MEERTGVRTEEEAMSVMMEDIGRQILTVTRSELYLSMRFLDVALSSFQFVMDPQMETIGTDGLAIYYEPSLAGGTVPGGPDTGKPGLSPYGAPRHFPAYHREKRKG